MLSCDLKSDRNLSREFRVYFTAMTLQNCRNLLILDISYNALHFFHFIYVNQCHNLQELFLHNNLISYIRLNNTLLLSLRLLRLDSNFLMTLDDTLLAMLPALDILNITNNTIDDIYTYKSQFGGKHCGSNATTFRAGHNGLTSVPAGLGSLCMLQHVSLNHNNISAIPRYTIERLSDLYDIDLSNNNINWLDVGTFNNPNLRWINLSHNKIAKLISMVFLFIPKVQHIDLSYNQLHYIYDYSIYHACSRGNRIALDISHNNLTSNAITNVLKTFNHSNKLYKCYVDVNMTDNAINYFAQDKKKLKLFYKYKFMDITIYLQNNVLVCDQHMKSQLEYLYIYNILHIFRSFKWLQCNNINMTVDKFFYDTTLPGLEIFFCPASCQCNNFVNSYVTKPNNFFVNCSALELEAVPTHQFYVNTHFILSHNQLRYLDNNVTFSIYITLLDLSFNQITFISTDIWRSVLLIQVVFLDNNQLTTLQYAPDNPVNAPCIISLSLMHNPIHCTYNRALLDYYHDCVKDIEQYSCGRDDANLMSDLYNSDNLSYTSSMRTVYILIVLIGVTSSSCVIWCGVYYKRNYLRYYHGTYQDRQRVYTTEINRDDNKQLC